MEENVFGINIKKGMCSLRVTKKKPKHRNKTKPKKLKKGALNTA